MMILPIRTSIRPRHTTYANYALIVLNILIFMITYHPHQRAFRQEVLREWAIQFMLDPSYPYLWQFITYAFLHHNFMHLFGNMYFLYIFGENVNDKLGNLAYVCLYLAGAVFAGVGHSLFRVNPVLGASGAVAAITGAYLVLFPRTLITVFYWFFFYLGTIDIAALYFIGLKLIVWDNIFEAQFSGGSIAHGAHIAGYMFGIIASLIMIALGFIKRSQQDLFFMILQWNRRRRYRDVVSSGYDPYTGKMSSKWVENVAKTEDSTTPEQEKINNLRIDVVNMVNQRNLASAADKYIELLEINSDAVVPQKYQLDIANQLMSAGKWAFSAKAYELLLKHYPNIDHIEQIHLMLGILYCRYLNNKDKAIEYLESAKDKLSDPGQKQLCISELEKLA